MAEESRLHILFNTLVISETSVLEGEKCRVSSSTAWESSEQHFPSYQVGAPGDMKSLSPPSLAL